MFLKSCININVWTWKIYIGAQPFLLLSTLKIDCSLSLIGSSPGHAFGMHTCINHDALSASRDFTLSPTWALAYIQVPAPKENWNLKFCSFQWVKISLGAFKQLELLFVLCFVRNELSCRRNLWRTYVLNGVPPPFPWSRRLCLHPTQSVYSAAEADRPSDRETFPWLRSFFSSVRSVRSEINDRFALTSSFLRYRSSTVHNSLSLGERPNAKTVLSDWDCLIQ